MLNNNELIIARGCYDPLSAKIIESIALHHLTARLWLTAVLRSILLCLLMLP